MKIASTVARYLMGLLFVITGLNGFLNFLPMPPKPPLPTQFVTMLGSSHYMVLVFVLQLVSGLLFLANRYVALALTLIAPVIVNILLFHVLMDPAGIAPGILSLICWILVFIPLRSAFSGILKSQAQDA